MRCRDPAPERALRGLGLVDDRDQLEIGLAERHDPVGGAPAGVTAALDRRQAMPRLDLLRGCGKVGHRDQYVVELQSDERSRPAVTGQSLLSQPAAVATDPVSVNGVDMSVAALVERARAAQRAFADLRMELIEEIEAPGRVVIVFWQRGRHVGPLEMPLGEIGPTGRGCNRDWAPSRVTFGRCVFGAGRGFLAL